MPATISSATNSSAPSTSKATPPAAPHKPSVSHVNMQLDCFIANVNPDDLRAIVRTLIATGPNGTTSAFTNVAKKRMVNRAGRGAHPPSSFFTSDNLADKPRHASPTPQFFETLKRARTWFGIGLAFESLPILVQMVETAYKNHTWELYSPMEDALITLDGDIAQAIQSCREQVASKEVADLDAARQQLADLRRMLEESQTVIEGWGGEFPFEKGILALTGWKL